eukprot:Opistho-2@12010
MDEEMENSIDPAYECDAPMFFDFSKTEDASTDCNDGADEWFERREAAGIIQDGPIQDPHPLLEESIEDINEEDEEKNAANDNNSNHTTNTDTDTAEATMCHSASTEATSVCTALLGATITPVEEIQTVADAKAAEVVTNAVAPVVDCAPVVEVAAPVNMVTSWAC